MTASSVSTTSTTPFVEKNTVRPVIATLGPASLHLTQALAEAGATAFRLNGSHMTPEQLDESLGIIRACSSLTVVIDLQGTKMRFGTFDPVQILHGQTLVLGHQNDGAVIPVPHPELFLAARVGQTLTCDDDKIRLRIDDVYHDHMVVTSLSNATLKSRKGLNLLENPVYPERMADADVHLVRVAMRHANTMFACSFMRHGREADWIRQCAPGCSIAGKIEHADGVNAIMDIAQRVDSVWICRGDLGAQLGEIQMARWISEFDPSTLPVPTLIAGQVLEHLTYREYATRSEVCHLVDLLRRGYQGLVLSDETAIGSGPVRATRKARELLTGYEDVFGQPQ